MTAGEAIAALVAHLATMYPARTSVLSNRPGRVTCVVAPVTAEFEAPVCAPGPVRLEVDIHILAAGADEQAVVDLLTHLEPVAGLARAAGFTPLSWRGGTLTDTTQPEVAMTCTIDVLG